MKIAAGLTGCLLVFGAGAAALGHATELAKPRVGGTVVVGIAYEPACLNLFMIGTCSGGVGPPFGEIVQQVLEGAFEVGPDLTYRPNVVSRVKLTKNPATLTYVIRPEARWSDGVPVSAADLVFTSRVHTDHPKLEFHSKEWKDAVVSVRAIGPKTVRFRVSRLDARWRSLFPFLFPRHALVGEDLQTVWSDAFVNPKTGRPIGNGPVLTQHWERGRQLTLVRNPRYWGPHKAYLDRIVFRFFPTPEAALEALRAGRVDLVSAPPGAEAVNLGRRIKVVTGLGLRFELIAIRVGPGGHLALKRPFVRRALVSAIDRHALVRELFRTTHPRLQPLENAIFMSNSRFYRPHWNIHNRKQARVPRMLERNGCRRATDGIYTCDGQRLSFRFITTAARPQREQIARIIQAQVRKAGIEIVPIFTPSRVLFDEIMPKGDFDLALYTSLASPDPADFNENYVCGKRGNWFGYCNRRVTKDLVKTNEVLSMRSRAALFNRADAEMARDVPLIPLFQQPSLLAFKRNLRGVRDNASVESYTWNSEDWWLAR
jgi:peptide/nickel transport system substrate-binding protein